MLLVTFCWQHVSVTVANNLRIAVLPSPNANVLAIVGIYQTEPNIRTSLLYLCFTIMFMHFVMSSISGTFFMYAFFFPPAGWNFKQIQRWNIYTLLLQMEFWQTLYTHFWACPSSTFKWVETTKNFFPIFFIYQLMLGMCKHAHLYDYLLCTSISLSLF